MYFQVTAARRLSEPEDRHPDKKASAPGVRCARGGRENDRRGPVPDACFPKSTPEVYNRQSNSRVVMLFRLVRRVRAPRAGQTGDRGRRRTTLILLRIRCSALLRQEFDAPPIELRNTGSPEQLVEGMRGKEGHQGGLVHAGSGCLSQARFPAPPHPNRRGRHPNRFRCREQQKDAGVAKQGQHDQTPLLVRRAGHVRIEPASLFPVAGMTPHAPSMWHRRAELSEHLSRWQRVRNYGET